MRKPVEKGEYLYQKPIELKEKHESGQIWSKGLLIGFEL